MVNQFFTNTHLLGFHYANILNGGYQTVNNRFDGSIRAQFQDKQVISPKRQDLTKRRQMPLNELTFNNNKLLS